MVDLDPSPVIHAMPWWEPELALSGHSPLDVYTETYWTPVLGPASSLALRWFARMFESHHDGFDVGFADFARHLGLGSRRGRNSPAARCVRRLEYFDLARGGERLMVRTHVPDVPPSLIRRLPVDLRRLHTPNG